MSDTESVSERELAEQLQNELFSGQPRSVGEALTAADEVAEPPVETPPEPPPVVVTDEPEQPEPPEAEGDTPEGQEPGEVAAEPGEELETEEPEGDTEDDPNVVWAKKRYGDDTAKWAKGAREQDQHISRLTNEKREAEQLAVQWYEYAQQAEREASQQSQMGMPLSASEENWVEQAMANPYGYARQAAFQGNVNLYNAVLARVAEENPGVAASIGSQIQVEMQQIVAAENGQMQAQATPPPLDQTLGASFRRLGIDLAEAGPSMMEKVSEMGEYHPYVQAILHGDDGQRDLAVQAVYDLVREGQFTKRRVRDEDREATIRREAELRREAAGVVTGSPHTPPPQTNPLMDAMEAEWRARGQWSDE